MDLGFLRAETVENTLDRRCMRPRTRPRASSRTNVTASSVSTGGEAEAAARGAECARVVLVEMFARADGAHRDRWRASMLEHLLRAAAHTVCTGARRRAEHQSVDVDQLGRCHSRNSCGGWCAGVDLGLPGAQARGSVSMRCVRATPTTATTPSSPAYRQTRRIPSPPRFAGELDAVARGARAHASPHDYISLGMSCRLPHQQDRCACSPRLVHTAAQSVVS